MKPVGYKPSANFKAGKAYKVTPCGKNAFYSIDDDHVKKIIEQMLIHIEEN